MTQNDARAPEPLPGTSDPQLAAMMAAMMRESSARFDAVRQEATQRWLHDPQFKADVTTAHQVAMARAEGEPNTLVTMSSAALVGAVMATHLAEQRYAQDRLLASVMIKLLTDEQSWANLDAEQLILDSGAELTAAEHAALMAVRQ